MVNGHDQRSDGERPWQEVQRRKNRGFAGANKGWGRRDDPRQTTFYVANLPNGTSAKDLETCFEPYGKVADAYVAVKRDRAGALFGFVRFSGVVYKREMERSLSSVTLNNAILSVNLAKFDRGGNRCSREKRTKPLPPWVGQPRLYRAAGYEDLNRGNKSYRDALIKNQTIQHPVSEVVARGDAEFNAIQWYDLFAIGNLKDFNQLCCLHLSIDKAGIKLARMRNLVGTGYTPYARMVWLRIHGVPPQLWEAQVFDELASNMGKVVAPSQAAFSDGVLTYDTVGILVREGWSLPEEITLKWQDKIYRCWFQIEDDDWCPGWIVKHEKRQLPVPNQVSSGGENQGTTEQSEEDEQTILVPGDRPRMHGEGLQNHGDSVEQIMKFLPRPTAIDTSNNIPWNIISEIVPSRPSHFPDLNSQIQRLPQDEQGNCEMVDVSGARGGDRIHGIRSSEVGETINMGKELGVNLENFEELVRSVIEGEMETKLGQ
ncbi:hypothetical protein L1987_85086 [Smallanthus sonchifolius]|uniref:Uncharacterized protein n=1 Tax=Smallanthus sonchifolius TaxID=185202 RepID=A0ACB8XVS8_9ASTR|nr:hypothetical protein L1987_85086 [Smallanthus sonchifolius]